MITISPILEGNRLNLSIQGHAGYAEAGKDIVCAAVSAITYTLLQAVFDAGIRPDKFREEAGNFYVSAKLDDRTKIAAQALLRGYERIAAAYPENIFVKK